MLKNVLKLSWAFATVLCLSFVACENEDSLSTTDIENYTVETVNDLEVSARCGRGGCFEFVFPISIAFPDGTGVEIADYDALHDAIRAWKEANPDSDARPELSFPLEVIGEDGAAITIANQEELIALKKECPKPPRGGDHGKGRPCFKLVFPLSISFPDLTVAEAADHKALHQLLREWKQANPTTDTRPELVFPVTIQFKDETTQEVASADDLKAAKEACRE